MGVEKSPPSHSHVDVPTFSSMNSYAHQKREEHLTRQRLWRQRRLDKTQTLREQVQLMEQIALTLPLIKDANEIWDEFLDDDTKRVRGILRQFLPTTQQIRALIAQQHQLQRMLAEHQLASKAIDRMLSMPKLDEWDDEVQRWKALARMHFRPWTPEQSVAAMSAAIIETDRFTHSRDKQSTGMSIMGWHDSRRIDRETSSFQFSFHKIFRGYDLDYYTSTGWRVYMETALYNKVVVGRRGKSVVDVLQELTPRLAVVLYHDRYEGVDINFHSLNLLATVETKDGVTQFIRSIEAAELLSVFNRPNDMWVSKFYWKQFDVLDLTKPRHSTDFRMSLRGSIRGNDIAYVNRWLFEVLGSVVRDEVYSSGRRLLAFD